MSVFQSQTARVCPSRTVNAAIPRMLSNAWRRGKVLGSGVMLIRSVLAKRRGFCGGSAVRVAARVQSTTGFAEILSPERQILYLSI